jgi:DNA repair protein RadA/Sms
MSTESTARKTYHCTKCDVRFMKALARCTECGTWGSVKEGVPDTMAMNVIRMSEISPECTYKVPTGLDELDAALDGGTVPGQVILLGGRPGAGKSTLVLEIADAMMKRGVLSLESGKEHRKKKNRCLLVSTEEDVEKIKARSLRIDKAHDILLCHQKEWSLIECDFADHQPEFGIIDSLNRIVEGRTEQGRVETLHRIYDYAHATAMTTFVIAHVNGDDEIAGMISLQHGADTILILERDRIESDIRALRVRKNRHGSEDYVGLFEMTEKGLYSYDPAKDFNIKKLLPGQAFSIGIIGGKSLPIEVQALAPKALKPFLSVVGYPTDRVRSILATMSEHTSIDTDGREIFVQIVGGLNFTDPGIDAAIAMAIASAVRKKPLPPESAYVGEVDLLGQVKAGGRHDQRKEIAKRHGFKLRCAEDLDELLEEWSRK